MRQLRARGMRRGLAFLFAAVIAFGQGSQYPPGQYPPGQYPPGQYPPGQYPPGQYPSTGGLPMPQIKWPKRKPKEESAKKDPAAALTSVEGTLRSLGEKELLLDTGKDRVQRFRLLAKTKFLNKDGEPVRDSLLRPGDQLKVGVNPDDPETAIQVSLVRAGTEAERAAAAKPVEKTAVTAPATVEARADSTEKPPSPDDIIAEAREAAASFTADLPNFLVQQSTTRYASNSNPSAWRAIDIVTADVVCVEGKESYRNVQINGRPSDRPIETTGSWSTGEFIITLQDLFATSTDAAFVKRGAEKIGSRDVVVFDYKVKEENSHWILVTPDGRQIKPAYGGSVAIDKDTHRVLRIEQRTAAMPRGSAYQKAECIIEYGFVDIQGLPYLLPIQSENQACMAGSANCVRNVINFRNYRKFTADSNITFEKFAPSPGPAPRP
jgi:hypothetical protein